MKIQCEPCKGTGKVENIKPTSPKQAIAKNRKRQVQCSCCKGLGYRFALEQ